MNLFLFLFSFMGILTSLVLLNEDIEHNSNITISFNHNNINIISLNPPLVIVNEIFNNDVYSNITLDYNKNLFNSHNSIYKTEKFIHSHILHKNESFIMNIFHNENFVNFIKKILNETIKITPLNHPNSNIIKSFSINNSAYNLQTNLYIEKMYNGIYTLTNNKEPICFKLNNKTDCINKNNNSLIIYDPTRIPHKNIFLSENITNTEYHIRFVTNKNQNLKNLFNRYFLTLEGPQSLFSNVLF